MFPSKYLVLGCWKWTAARRLSEVLALTSVLRLLALAARRPAVTALRVPTSLRSAQHPALPALQGYLAHNLNPKKWNITLEACKIENKTPTPLGSPYAPRHRATVGPYGGAVSYERGTHVVNRFHTKRPHFHGFFFAIYDVFLVEISR